MRDDDRGLNFEASSCTVSPSAQGQSISKVVPIPFVIGMVQNFYGQVLPPCVLSFYFKSPHTGLNLPGLPLTYLHTERDYLSYTHHPTTIKVDSIITCMDSVSVVIQCANDKWQIFNERCLACYLASGEQRSFTPCVEHLVG